MAKLNKFYEVQQRDGSGRWNKVGFFKTKKAAEKYCAEFNTKVVVHPTKIVEREFTG